ncbi:glycosyltransferase family 39 protein [Chitinophaga sp. Mgbs1]|uniref:Glycosyltransferase family 39 protein n=1 Tax=Chitinophaga solisilvae TaxID=1233460 RepID=A0A3S1AXA1_9BACT|nr:glycosyltransferase family 39 protein [Chitinophaga solisilvae]
MRTNKPLTSPLLLLLFLLIKLIFQYAVLNPVYDLHRDEFLHLDLANHLSAGYLSVPPYTAVNSLVIKWLGNGIFWVHFFPALYGMLTMIIIWKMIDMLGGSWYAQTLAAAMFICSAMSRVNLLYQPNSFDILAWAAVCWCLLEYLHTSGGRWLLWMGVITGLGILNKYNIGFLVAGLLGALLLSSHRKIFKDKHLYIGGLIALAIAAPNLIWQVRYGFPVLHHMKELTETQLVNVDRMAFVADQFIFFIGGAFLMMAALVGLLFFRPFRPYRVFLLAYIIIILLYLYLRGKSYYSLGIYPVLIAFGCVYWERIFQGGWTKNLRLVWLALVIVPFALIVNAIFPVLTPDQIQQKARKFSALGLLRWEDGKDHELPQDFADMLGWRELAGLTLKAWQQIPADQQKNTLIIGDNYGHASAVNFYNLGKMPAAVCMDADYVFWFPQMDTIRYIIKIGRAPEKEVMPLIGKVTEIGSIKETLSREYGSAVYILSDLSPQVPQLLRKRVQQRQQDYRGLR